MSTGKQDGAGVNTGGDAVAFGRGKVALAGIALIAATAIAFVTFPGDPAGDGAGPVASLPALPRDPAVAATLPAEPIGRPRGERAQTAAAPVEMSSSFDEASDVPIGCAVSVGATALAAAFVSLEISAPCDAGARADLMQGDLRVAVALDREGRRRIAVPALSRDTPITVLVSGRAPVVTTTEVTDLGGYTRAILQWHGDVGLELHAIEGDTDHDSADHVSPDAPRGIVRTLTGRGGFLMPMGDAALADPRMALVYTAPAALPVDLTVEAPVLARNCGRDVVAGTIRTAPGGPARAAPITLTMPDCDATGGYVLLGEVPEHVVLAAN